MFPQWPHLFTAPLAVCEGDHLSTSLPALVIACQFDCCHPSDWEVVSHCGYHVFLMYAHKQHRRNNYRQMLAAEEILVRSNKWILSSDLDPFCGEQYFWFPKTLDLFH